MRVSDLKAGAVIEGSKWPEPVEIQKIESFGDNVRLIGSTTNTGVHVNVILSNEEIEHINLQTIQCDFSSESWKLFLGLETIRYRFASDYDPLLAMSTSKVDPLPHQIEAVYSVVLKMPRIRFLLAHDPGAGKTIMAGLIIKEMKLRHLVNRILIVVPGHLKDQWRRELEEKFKEIFVVVDRGVTNSLYGQNIWDKENNIITSIDFAKKDDILSSLSSSHFHLIIVDEAHKMAAYKYNNKYSKTRRYKLGEILSNRTEHLLFLTATPHKGDTDNFRLFLDLLQPGFFATSEMLEESIRKNENTLFLRKRKEDMRDFEGRSLFMPRHVYAPTYNLSVPERELYKKVTEYVRTQYNKALSSEKKRNIGFALVILQRRLASSCYALCKSLIRRRDRLKEIFDNFDRLKKIAPQISDFEDIEEMDENERWQHEKLLETLSIAGNREELSREIETLDSLINEAKNVIDQGVEVKLQKLKEAMELLEQKTNNKKILIFTESKDTLEYVEKKLVDWGYNTNCIHGGMNLKERVNAEAIFRTEAQVMVATEAAGEGINLQFCHLMINYDIPWNPNRLEQRMGRIHRYGQKYEVFAYNLIAQDTIEGRIFKKLFEKLEEIKLKMGNDKVYDIIGSIYKNDLSQLLIEAAIGAKTEKEIFATLERKVDQDFINKLKDDLGDTLATKHIDFTQIKEQQQKARENRLIPEYTAEFFKKAFTHANGKIRDRKNEQLYSIDYVPTEIRKIAENDEFRKSFGTVKKIYQKISFSKEVDPEDQDSEFLTFGHPLFEAVLEWVVQNFNTELRKGAQFTDPSGNLNGCILFYEGKILDGLGDIAGKRLFAYYVDSKTSTIEFIEPSVLWDLKESDENFGSMDVEKLKTSIESQMIPSLREYQKELQEERNRQSQIKEKYGIESLKKLILDLDRDLVDLRNRKQLGDNVDLPIHNKEETQKQYIHNKKELINLIQHEKSLTISTPTFLGIVRVGTPQTIKDEFRKDVKTEQIAMQVVIEYERSKGRIPKDVSKIIGPGYDIKSFDYQNNVRYIEVKGRKDAGSVALSKNEWFKAKHLGRDYYLYVVWNIANYPDILGPKIIQDPVANLIAKEDTHYLISSLDIERKSQ